MVVLLLLHLVCAVRALSAPMARRGFVDAAVGVAASTVVGANALTLVPAVQLVDELKQLRLETRAGRANAKKVAEATEKTLVPLRRAMEQNPNNEDSDTAALQPLLLKGHMLELEQALASPDGFKEYVSKTTKDTYPGGKVERELEEAVETAEAYCGALDCYNLLVYR